MSIGLFGGTFDPIHCGHLDVAQAARRALGLDVVWLVPARVPPHRANPRVSAAHRFAMVALAVADQPGLLVSDLEMDLTTPSYTVETLGRVESAGGHASGSLFFVTGADAFREIGSWKAYPEVLDRCHFVVVSRPGSPAGEMRRAFPEFASRMLDAPSAIPSGPRIFLVDAPTSAVSSTEVRRAVAQRASLEGMVPAGVAAHIARHALYGFHDRETPQG